MCMGLSKSGEDVNSLATSQIPLIPLLKTVNKRTWEFKPGIDLLLSVMLPVYQTENVCVWELKLYKETANCDTCILSGLCMKLLFKKKILYSTTGSITMIELKKLTNLGAT